MDWLGVGLLAFFMPMLISGLHALPAASSAPPAAVIPLVLAATSFAAMLWVEMRNPRPLLDFGLFSNHNFGLASGLAFLLMFDIVTLLGWIYCTPAAWPAALHSIHGAQSHGPESIDTYTKSA